MDKIKQGCHVCDNLVLVNNISKHLQINSAKI